MCALAALPSYLDRPNFIAAMEGGASAGLRARQADIEESQAADRLKLAYDQLAKQERVANMQALARQQQGQAAMALRAAIAQQGMDLRSQALEQQQKNQDAMMDLRQSQFEEAQKQNLSKAELAQNEFGEKKRHNLATEARRTGKSPADMLRDNQADIFKSHIKNLQNKLAATDPKTDQYNQLSTEMAQTSFALRQLYPRQQTTLGGTSAAPPPGTVRKFTYKDGKIVPVDTQGDSMPQDQGDEEEEE